MTDFYRWQHLLEPSISVFKLIRGFCTLSVVGKIIAVKFFGDSHVCHFINENEVLKR